MTYLTLKMREDLLEKLLCIAAWCVCFAGFVWFIDPAVAEAMVALPIGTIIMMMLGIMNDVEHGVITEEEWETRRIM